MSLPRRLNIYIVCSVLVLSLANFQSMLAYSIGDADGDGILDDIDNCPSTANSDQLDSDHDGRGDACDPFPNDPRNDADDDGISGEIDNCPSTANSDQLDSDHDGRGDACDPFPNGDTDHDGIDNLIDNCPQVPNPIQLDTDHDELGDACDPDRDNDGILNNQDNCPNVVNIHQFDNDHDGIGNACDTDIDGDGILNSHDTCPLITNANQEDIDSDGIGNLCDPDNDNDGILDGTDNCQFTANVSQDDADSDGTGNLCDPDDDNDGVLDGTDNCQFTANSGQEDDDNDGIGNVCDPYPNDSTNGADTDADGIPDILDNCPTVANLGQEDRDSDGIGNLCDPDNDNDGVLDGTDNCQFIANVSQEDIDSDGTGNLCDPDNDNDGVVDNTDNCPIVSNPGQEDTDNDGTGNVCDLTPNGNTGNGGNGNLEEDSIHVPNPGNGDGQDTQTGFHHGGNSGDRSSPSLILDRLTLLGLSLPDFIMKIILEANPFIALPPLDDPLVILPLKIGASGYALYGYSQTIETFIAETGKTLPIELNIRDETGVQHIALYLNLVGTDSEIKDSDTYIIYDEGNPLTIIDPHGFFEDVNFSESQTGSKYKAVFDIMFARNMDTSDIILRLWDEKRNSGDIKVFDAIRVIGEPIEKPTFSYVMPTETNMIIPYFKFPQYIMPLADSEGNLVYYNTFGELEQKLTNPYHEPFTYQNDLGKFERHDKGFKDMIIEEVMKAHRVAESIVVNPFQPLEDKPEHVKFLYPDSVGKWHRENNLF